MYEFSSTGIVRNVVTRRILRTRPLRGYQIVNLYSGARYGLGRSRRCTRAVHLLICEAFHGPRPRGKLAAHNNGISEDCRASNLRWDTPAGNHADKKRHGTNNHGAAHGLAKLTDKEVRQIIESTEIQRVIAARYGITQQHVSFLKRRKGWKNLANG